MSYCVDPEIDGEQGQNIVNIELRSGLNPDFACLDRHFLTTGACSLCGKASIEALKWLGHRFPTPDFCTACGSISTLNRSEFRSDIDRDRRGKRSGDRVEVAPRKSKCNKLYQFQQ
jgi:hypothetical protein